MPRPDHLRTVDVVGHAEHLAVDALHVIRLAESLDERLPVAVRRKRDQRVAPEVLDPRPTHLGGHRREIRVEGVGVRIEVHEDQRAPRADLHVEQRVLVVQHPELAARRHLTERTVEPPRPPVERAADLVQPGTRATAQLTPAMAAHVLERSERVVVISHDQYRIRTHAVLEPVARVGDVIDAARELPDARPQLSHLTSEELRRDVPMRRDPDRADARGGSGRLDCHGRSVEGSGRRVATGAQHGARPLVGELAVAHDGAPVHQHVLDAIGLGVETAGAPGRSMRIRTSWLATVAGSSTTRSACQPSSTRPRWLRP